MNALLVLFGIENACDGYLTWNIHRFGGHELDPILAFAIKSLGLYWALLLFKVGVVAGVWWWAFHGLDVRVLAGLDIAWAGIVGWNMWNLQDHKIKS